MSKPRKLTAKSEVDDWGIVSINDKIVYGIPREMRRFPLWGVSGAEERQAIILQNTGMRLRSADPDNFWRATSEQIAIFSHRLNGLDSGAKKELGGIEKAAEKLLDVCKKYSNRHPGIEPPVPFNLIRDLYLLKGWASHEASALSASPSPRGRGRPPHTLVAESIRALGQLFHDEFGETDLGKHDGPFETFISECLYRYGHGDYGHRGWVRAVVLRKRGKSSV